MKKSTKIIVGAANVLTAVGLGAVVGLDVFDVGTDVLEDKRLKDMRVETRVKKPGSIFKKKAIVDGYGNVVEWL
jgi:hypothetical protein